MRGELLSKETRIGVYVHVPFCVRKCHYCDFNSYAGGDALRRDYVDALCREIELVAETASREGEMLEASTLYIGGGTPTLLPSDEVCRILAACGKHLGWHSRLETTMEANPGTIDRSGASELRRAGVNRISLGVQSFDDSILRILGRIHIAEESMMALDAFRAAGFRNISLDLMYALPTQSLGHWEATLSEAIGLAPEHLSLYPLTIEEGTQFYRKWSEGELVIPSDDDAALMYEVATSMLADAGYEQYEISNWSLGGASFRCRHNITYWSNRPYLGFGAGAHSYWRGERFSNVCRPEDYCRLLNAGTAPVENREDIDVELEMKETVILGLRLADGIDRGAFSARFSRPLDEVFGGAIARLVEDGLLLEYGERVALTDRGRLLGNVAFVALLSSEVPAASYPR